MLGEFGAQESGGLFLGDSGQLPMTAGVHSAGLGLLAAAATVPTADAHEQQDQGSGGSDDGVEGMEDEGAGLVVASAVLDTLPQKHPTVDEQGQIIARQQKEIVALRELVASQAAAIEQLRRAANTTQTHAPSAPGTSPPPPYGPASPSSELVGVGEDFDVLSPASARPQSGLQHSHGFYHPQLAVVDAPAAVPDVMPPPTPTQQAHTMPRTPPSVHHGELSCKRLKGIEGIPSAAPSPSALAYSSVTLSLPPFRATVSGKSRPVGRTNTHVLWTAEEDACLRSLVMEHGEQAWALVASRMPHERNNKQCRERWRNHLRPQCNKGPWTEAEDALILERVQQHGTKWAKISGLYLPDRPENDIKNRWHILVRMNQHAGLPAAAAAAAAAAPAAPALSSVVPAPAPADLLQEAAAVVEA